LSDTLSDLISVTVLFSPRAQEKRDVFWTNYILVIHGSAQHAEKIQYQRDEHDCPDYPQTAA